MLLWQDGAIVVQEPEIAIQTPGAWMLRLVSPPEVEAGRDKAQATRTPMCQGIARRGQMAQSHTGLVAVHRVLRVATVATEGMTGVETDPTLRIGLAAGRGPPLTERDRGLETVDAVVTGREADRKALPQPLLCLLVR